MHDSGIEAASWQPSAETADTQFLECSACQAPVNASEGFEAVAAELCGTCFAALPAGGRHEARLLLQAIDAPFLLMQPEPRQVFTANDRALALFGRKLDEAEGHRGGEVFGCVHSYTPDGCGKDAHCSDCRIKAAIVSGFDGAVSAASSLTIRGNDGDQPYTLAVSAAKAGGYALVRIERFELENGGRNE